MANCNAKSAVCSLLIDLVLQIDRLQDGQQQQQQRR